MPISFSIDCVPKSILLRCSFNGSGVSKQALPKSRIKDVKVVVGGDQYLEYVRY